MTDASIASLARQSGLMKALSVTANNIANASTPGFKAEGTVFAEHVTRTGRTPSMSMGHLVAHDTDFTPGGLDGTGGTFDLAIDGEGFFKVQTPAGPRLTRAGAFTLDVDGLVVDPNGFPLVDGGGSPIEVPPEAKDVAIARDGTMSIDGEAYADIGVFRPRGEPVRAGSNHWQAPNGDDLIEEPQVLQGFLERSNVSAVEAFAEMIATQRLFDAGQTLSQQEHDRLSALIAAIRQE
ncbi:flagellar hook-basal body complex protein [Parvularcula dongshanensis]|uniref:Flagellar basal-body rod protein FlgF n=1 Tax=Parvularcula dongshanensis TaxID=1173995 RepID=A0A840I431_9PROT|nr:flagellar basal-body rod protein FlgF [Parvularcula dongshanensis]